MKLIQQSNGLWNPDTDTVDCFSYSQTELQNVDHLVGLCEVAGIPLNNVIHAGGHIGMYALEFAKHFKTIYTFEPENDNFSALMTNCALTQNIFPFKAALGYDKTPIKLTDDCKGNIGGWQVINTAGNIPMIRLDDLNLQDISLIHLDVEGYELFVLKGAEDTIKRNLPLICFEILGHNETYNYKVDEITKFLFDLGYTSFTTFAHEIAYCAVSDFKGISNVIAS